MNGVALELHIGRLVVDGRAAEGLRADRLGEAIRAALARHLGGGAAPAPPLGDRTDAVAGAVATTISGRLATIIAKAADGGGHGVR